MADIVGAYALTHSSLMVGQPELVADELREACYAAYHRVRQELVESKVDVLVVLGSDHFNSYFYDLFPQWCVGRADSYEGWADNMPMYKLAGHRKLSADVIDGLLDRGCEPALSEQMRLDHSFLSPLHFITPDMDLPVVPIFQNCLSRPFPRLARSLAFGRALGEAIRASAVDARVAVIGTGGLSHWIGGPDHGRLNPEFDREFLDRFARNDVDWLTGFSDEDIERHLGSGGHEVRNWLTVRGCLPNGAVERFFYEPIEPWWIGAAVAAVRTGEAR
ncbi:hypothetical protein ABZ863_29850 [Saccharomonospora sp. NPDC046836]|uniref:DODA-type extradiol aromatic ring-opening family dioxygenase n=1 Tax=Saccharomonospora sp. NPDC046836 TaxID=3156921 RepID=UPI0033DB1F78